MGIPRLLFPVLLSMAGFAQTVGQVNVWIPRGPEGGVVGRPTIDPRNPGTLYIAAAGTLFKTTDAAGHWSGFGAAPVTVVAVDPQNSDTLYGANNNAPFASTNALFKSTDGGLTWNPSGAGVPCPCTDLTAFVVDPANQGTLYAAYDGTSGDVNGGVYKSTDGGAIWSKTSVGLPVFQPAGMRTYSGVRALVIDPANSSTLYAAAGLSLSAGGGVYKSTDGAASWSAINSGLPDNAFIDSLAIDPRNPTTLYADSGAFRSTDGGSSWSVVPRSGPRPAQGLVVDPQDSSTLYAVGGAGVVKSADGGGSWSVVLPDVSLQNSSYPWVAVVPGAGGASTIYAGGTVRGVLKSSDGGLTWATANSGLIATWIDSLAIDPQDPRMVIVGVERAGLYKSTDGAVSWSPVLPGVNVFALANDPQEPGTVYASGSGLYKSIDDGASWVQLPVAPAGTDLAAPIFPLAVDTRNTGTVYSGGFKSTDGGASWAKLGLLLTALAIDPRDSGTLYAGTIAGELATSVLSISSGVRKSVDGGRSWSGVNTAWQAYGVSSLAVDPTNSSVVYAQTGGVDCSESYVCNSGYWDPNSDEAKKGFGLFKSTDGGATWAKLDLPAAPFEPGLLGITPQGTLYAWAAARLVRSMDGGATWNALPTAGLPAEVSAVAFDPQNQNHLFAGTYGAGVFEITLGPVQP